CPLESAAGKGAQDEMFVSRMRIVVVDAEDDARHPFADRADGVMVERVHSLVLKTAPFDVSVPALPYGRRAVVYRILPRGKAALVDEMVGHFVVAGARQLQHHSISRMKARRHMAVVATDAVEHVLQSRRAQ